MTTIQEYMGERIYDGEKKILDVHVDIDIETIHYIHSNEAVDVMVRLQDVVEKELQSIQDERDTNE